MAETVRFQRLMPQNGLVDSEALLNQAIEARRSIESRRAALISQLRNVPTGRRAGHRAAAIEAELKGLDREATDLSRQEAHDQRELDRRHVEELRNTESAHKEAVRQQSLETARQAGEVFIRGTQIFQKYKPGDPRINEEMGKLRDQFPLGFDSMAIKGHFGKLAAFHDAEADRTQRNLAAALFKQTGLSPEQFASGVNARATNVPILKPDKTAPTHEEIEKNRATNGTTVAMEINGVTHLFKRGFFDNLNTTFREQPTTRQATVIRAPSAEEQAQAAGFRSAAQAQGFSGGKPLLDFAPAGTATTGTPTPEAQALTTERSRFIEQNPSVLTQGRNLPSNLEPRGTNITGTPVTDRLVREGRVSVGGEATLPRGVKPNAPIEPVMQLGVQPVAGQPASTVQVTAPSGTTARQQPQIDHTAAVNWAKANPNDPRSKRILELNPQ